MRLPLLAAALLAGCEAASPPAAPVAVAGPTGGPVAYLCEGGHNVTVTLLGADQASVNHDGEVLDMVLMSTVDGARYVGDGHQWWSRGLTEGNFAPLAPGEEVASHPGVDCSAD